ncbi:hypothetical protein SEVIR_5G250050v4 [Setaria viridis]|uniref:Uncharacterized protein n=1 Tax=Setaria viridis TaxID=4556 RepID=A0A4U6UNQ0_SETVI|nr:hypothetical protein SEVIR_5G250050v2 [Setaria viridis]
MKKINAICNIRTLFVLLFLLRSLLSNFVLSSTDCVPVQRDMMEKGVKIRGVESMCSAVADASYS